MNILYIVDIWDSHSSDYRCNPVLVLQTGNNIFKKPDSSLAQIRSQEREYLVWGKNRNIGSGTDSSNIVIPIVFL
jgi:hypothetical protein